MVYVDPEIACLPNGRYRWNTVSHLFADTEDELHAFARKLGLRGAWFQDSPKLKHYDLNHATRLRAEALGVVQLSRREAVTKWRELRGEFA
jgi:hypothetical protein